MTSVPRRDAQCAFTLVEVLIALAIVSIALAAALRAAGQGTQEVDALRSRLLAGWVAQNLMAKHHARREWLPVGIRRGSEREGGIDFAWREEVSITPNPGFRRLDVFVSEVPANAPALVHYTGFIVH